METLTVGAIEAAASISFLKSGGTGEAVALGAGTFPSVVVVMLVLPAEEGVAFLLHGQARRCLAVSSDEEEDEDKEEEEEEEMGIQSQTECWRRAQQANQTQATQQQQQQRRRRHLGMCLKTKKVQVSGSNPLGRSKMVVVRCVFFFRLFV